MRISAINTYKPINRQNNNSNKNNTNITLKPAFGGHVEKPMILDNNGDISFYILGQDMRPLFKNERVNKKIASDDVIASFLAQNIEAYNKNFDKNRTFEKTDNKYDTTIYVADPNETVSDAIRKEHGYIVYDNEPEFPTLEQLRAKYTSRTANPHDYFKDLRDYITYQQRVISADEDGLENPFDKNTSEQEENYKIRIDKAKQKVIYAQNLYNIMYKTGEDFMYKDYLVNRLEDLKEKSQNASSRMEDIAFHKYLVDEGIKSNCELLVSNHELTPHERQGIQYAINSSTATSRSMQNEYDEYASIKANGPEIIRQTQDELNRVLDKMGRNFEEVKAYYENNRLENQ